jgi:glucokinase
MNEMTKSAYIGVDIGGTSIKLAIIFENGELLTKWEIPTNIENNGANIPQEIVWSIVDKLKECGLNKEHILGVGAGAPGYVYSKLGIVYEAVNIGWINKNLKEELENLLNIPVAVANDANLAALGEYWLGAGKGSDHLITVTLGTGVGGGIVVNGQVINGVNGTGGEIGHIVVTPGEGPDCNCGRQGCIETYASATGIVRQGLEAIHQGNSTSLTEIYKKEHRITSKDIFEEAKKGDLVSQKIIEKTTHLLGLMLANLATVINPGIILIGGGVANAKDQLLTPLKEAFYANGLEHSTKVCDIVLAQLGNDAGVFGAVYFVQQQLKDGFKESV